MNWLQKPTVREVITFVFHQLVGTWGVAFLASFISRLSLGVAQVVGWSAPLSFLHQLYSYRPYFPMQIILALYMGWLLRRAFDHKVMAWVWIIPSLIMAYALFANPTLLPDYTSVMTHAGVNQTSFSHYFGSGCEPSAGCLDQTLVTLPFYVSVSYSLGAWLAEHIGKKAIETK